MANRKFQDIIFKDCGPKLDIDKIVEFEKKIGHELPEDFRQFLREINGGVSIVRGFQCLEDSPPALGGNLDSDKIKAIQYLKSQSFWFPPSPAEIELFYKNSWRPRVVSWFYHLNRPLDDCIFNSCRRAKILDEPDVRSLIPFATADEGDLYISICKDYFGFIYYGSYNIATNPSKVLFPTKGKKNEPLANLEKDLVAHSFTGFVSRLFFSKVMLAEGYKPSEEIIRDNITRFEDNPEDANLPLEDESNLDQSVENVNVAGSFASSLGLEKIAQEDDDIHLWEGRICLNEWTDFTEDEDGWVRLRIESENSDSIPDRIFDDIRSVTEKQKKLRNLVLRAAIKELEDYDEFDSEEFSVPDGLIGFMALNEIRVFFASKDYPAQVGYVLSCEWADEHGLAVLVKGGKVIDVGPEDILFYH